MISDFKFHTFFSGFISKSKKTVLFDNNRFSFMYAKKTFPLKHKQFSRLSNFIKKNITWDPYVI